MDPKEIHKPSGLPVGKPAIPVGTRVRFVLDGVGASVPDDLAHTTGETYGLTDTGTVAFAHPNRKVLPDWFYVEVPSKAEQGALRYVGVSKNMAEVLGG